MSAFVFRALLVMASPQVTKGVQSLIAVARSHPELRAFKVSYRHSHCIASCGTTYYCCTVFGFWVDEGVSWLENGAGNSFYDSIGRFF